MAAFSSLVFMHTEGRIQRFQTDELQPYLHIAYGPLARWLGQYGHQLLVVHADNSNARKK